MALRCFVLLILLAMAVTVAAGDLGGLLIVAHPDVTADAVSGRELRRIYLGKSTRWDGGLAIRPVMLDRQHEMTLFVDEGLDRTLESFSTYWKRMVFTGKGRPPRMLATPDEVALFVRVTPGAVGFLPGDADCTGLKVLRVD